MRLKGKVAVITGSARGIGRACAFEFAKQGADLVLLDICNNIKSVPYPLGSDSQLQYTAKKCRELHVSVLTECVDIRKQSEIDALVKKAINRFGKIDILLNNAGIVSPSGKIVHEVTEDDWATMIDVNLSGAWRMIKAVGEDMISRKTGSIINIASTAGVVGYRYFSGYVAAKHGLVGLTKSSALDYAPYKVRVNAVCPGSVIDKIEHEGCMLSEVARCLDINSTDHVNTFAQGQPTNTLIEPEDIALASLWLASDESKQVTGSVSVIDGGYTAR